MQKIREQIEHGQFSCTWDNVVCGPVSYTHLSVGITTALCPYIGYQKAASIAKKSLKTGESVTSLVLKDELLTQKPVSYTHLDVYKRQDTNRCYLAEILRNKAHRLSPETERAISALSQTLSLIHIRCV